MKKWITIFLLSIYLISSTELSELTKLPMLVEHYMEHKTENSNLSFFNFLVMHYTDNNAKDADYAKDMKLPFKSHNGCIHFSSVTFTPIVFYDFYVKLDFPTVKSCIIYTEKFIPSTNSSSIWQPPKSC